MRDAYATLDEISHVTPYIMKNIVRSHWQIRYNKRCSTRYNNREIRDAVPCLISHLISDLIPHLILYPYPI